MRTNNADTTFLIFEGDPIVRMDIHEALVRQHACMNVRVIDSLDETISAISQAHNPCVVIGNVNPEMLDTLSTPIELHGDCGFVSLTDMPSAVTSSAFPLEAVQRPFSTSTLLNAVQSVLESLHSSR